MLSYDDDKELWEVLNGSTLGELVKGFDKDVSVSIFVDSCEGGAFGGVGNVEQTQLVQVIGASTVIPSIDFPCRRELFQDFMQAIDNAANGTPNGTGHRA